IAFQHNGENLSLNLKDKPSGKLTLNPGLISVDKNIAILTINLRYPVSSNTEEIYDILTRQLERTNIGIVKLLEKTPLYKKLDNPLIEALLEVYREETGDEISKPISIGGGTFARAFPNAVSFGPTFPNQIPCEHQKDEFISITHLLSLINIYAKAIQKLDAIL
ncbi:MAG: M20/M25/M40 family metallo-hydrolase, partial [Clostridiales Family XIII bacterium]|nr:M20/M25/M40 family metallo-hydrolase [Clostridiales Family XIII bacterium]